ncbi:related to MFS alpha-glucoside transporter [Cephalotrichum gorgonifer]|uniref:Related to MFS alpha-glucoside transporter n=1 Tax=Cephalotrichum gorgonifer TaxID=2041049 RepID=A0AAE8N2T2_9PEZI|nr:related to MFS alpha-glucoside transporter [Cephalotrichum gorgonifer]
MADTTGAAPKVEGVSEKRGSFEHMEAGTPPPGDNQLTWKYVKENKRVLAWCFYIFLLPVNFGYEISTLGKLMAVIPFLERFGREVDGKMVIAATDQQILNAANTIGLFVSAFITGWISDKIGRKNTIMIGCMACIGGIIWQYFSTTIMMLWGGKLLATLGMGLGHSLGPVFVAELAPTKMRGICLTLVNTMIVLGQWLNALCIMGSKSLDGDQQWRIPLITQIISPSLLLCGYFFLPESPSWLIIKGRTEEAAKSFRRFNGPNFNVDEAVAVTKAAVEAEAEVSRSGAVTDWLQCFKGPDGRRTLIICMVYISQQTIGVNFISGYLTYYFRLAGVNDPLAIGQAAFAIQLVGNMVSWPLVDRIGRRPIIVYGCIGMTAGLLLIGGIGTLNSPSALNAIVALMVIWGFTASSSPFSPSTPGISNLNQYQATLGAVAYAIGGETPSPVLRQKTYAINIMTATAMSCMVLQVMPYLINTDELNLGAKICFIFFAFSVPMCVYLYFCLPEMKGRTYLELQEMFQNRVPARKFRAYKCVGIEGTMHKEEDIKEEK